MASNKRKTGRPVERRGNALVAALDYSPYMTDKKPDFASFFTPPVSGEDLRYDASGKGPDFDSYFVPPIHMQELTDKAENTPNNPLAAKALEDWRKTAGSSEPYQDSRVYPEPPAGIKQGDFDWFAANARMQGPEMQTKVEQLAAQAKAEGRKEPNLMEMLELGSMVPGAMLQGAISAAASALTLPGDVSSGKQKVMDPTTGKVDEEAVRRSLDLTGLMSSGSFAGAPKGALGSGPVRLYHGSPNTFEKFDIGRAGSGPLTEGVDPMYGPGISFSSDFKAARDYAVSGGMPNAKGYVHGADIEPPENSIIDLGVPIDKQPPNVRAFFKKAGAKTNDTDSEFQVHIADKAYNEDFEPRKGFYNNLKKHGIAGVKDSAGEYTIYDPALVNIKESAPVATDAEGKHVEPQLNAGAKTAAPLLAGLGEDFSHAARVVDVLTTKAAPADQWIATLKNKGVKDEELDALNLPTGKQSVTKEEIQAAIARGTPEIKEVVLKEGGDIDELIWDKAGDLYLIDHPGANLEEASLHGWIDQYLEVADHQIRSSASPPAKYSGYQLPGGENYREILVTTPQKSGASPNAARYRQLAEMDYEDRVAQGGQREYADLGRQLEGQGLDMQSQTTGNYMSSHWDEPNVLGHIRVNDREIPADPSDVAFMKQEQSSARQRLIDYAKSRGRDQAQAEAEADAYLNQYGGYPRAYKTLHAEELQSDWHQQGKKKGYKAADADKVAREKQEALEAYRRELINKYNDPAFWHKLTPEERAKYDRFNAGTNNPEGVPDAPFKKSWPDLLLKRLVKRAVDEGYDAISWTDGATQAERYDLSKFYDHIRVFYDKQHDRYDVAGKPVGGRTTNIGLAMTPETLANTIGKELADKIVKDQELKELGKGGFKDYSGVDLKVGGEGMKSFYDVELPRRAKKIFGVQVETKKLPLKTDPKTSAHGMALPITPVSVHFLRLTPEIKAKVKAGQPLFISGAPILSDDGKYKLVPVEGNPFGEGAEQ